MEVEGGIGWRWEVGQGGGGGGTGHNWHRWEVLFHCM